jgi:hypothetical protein
VGVFILVSLHEAFKGQIEEEEVSALAEEASEQGPGYVPSQSKARASEIPAESAEPPVKQPLSMEQAARQAEAQIAALDNLAATAMKKRVVRKGAPSPPALPQ